MKVTPYGLFTSIYTIIEWYKISTPDMGSLIVSVIYR